MLTEEEKKIRRKEAKKRWKEKNKEKIAEYNKRYRAAHKLEQNESSRRFYYAHRETILEELKKDYAENPEKYAEKRLKYADKHKESAKIWRENNKEKRAEYDKLYQKEYKKTQMGRAQMLLRSYKFKDKLYQRGNVDFDAKWIVENIFTSKCVYCGESDWHKLGCDRIDNSKPHTKDNVVCSCFNCNTKRGTKDFEEFKNGLE